MMKVPSKPSVILAELWLGLKVATTQSKSARSHFFHSEDTTLPDWENHSGHFKSQSSTDSYDKAKFYELLIGQLGHIIILI